MKKKKFTYKNIVAILFSAFILFYFVTICERVVRSAFLGEIVDETYDSGSESSPDESEETDWSKIYPAQDDDDVRTETAVSVQPESIKSVYTSAVSDIEGKVDYFTSKLLFFRMKFIEFNSYFNKAIGNKLISGSDDVLVMADRNLTYYSSERDMTGAAKSISEFSEFVENSGSQFLYVQAPSKIDPENNYLPNGIKDYDNNNVDHLLDIFKKDGVEYLDLRKAMKQQNMDYTGSFYKTDHHWKTNVGLWAANQIALNLSELGIPYKKELLDINNYNEKVYKKFMFGSLGKKVSLAFAEPEDFSLYTPRFDTDFTVTYYDNTSLSGSFTNAMIDSSVLKKVDYYGSAVYSSYLYGINPIAMIENRKADNDKRVLFINDSFGCTVIPFFATQVRYVDTIDLRYFNGGVKSYIEKNKPDAVVVMYYPTTLSSAESGALKFR